MSSKHLNLAFLFPFILILTSCSKQQPKDVAIIYLNAVNNNQYEDAKKVSTIEIQDKLNQTSKLAIVNNPKSKNRTFKIINEKISGDISDVTYAIFNNDIRNEFNGNMRLIKKEDGWMIAENDYGYGEYLKQNADNQLHVELDALKKEVETISNNNLNAELLKTKGSLLKTINDYNKQLKNPLSSIQKLKLQEDVKMTRYYVSKFIGETENNNH